jgi:DNA polymerase III delta prime subunit
MEALVNGDVPEATRLGVLDHGAHLRRELRILELGLRREVLIARAQRGGGKGLDEFSGLYIPDEEIDRYMNADPGEATDLEPEGTAVLEARIAAERRALADDVRDAQEAGVHLRLEHLREAFGLSGPEYRILVACLAPDLDLRFERYFAYLQNDVSRRRPSVQLLGKLFLEDPADGPLLRLLFASGFSLAGPRLLELGRAAPDTAFAACQPRLAEGVINYLLEVDGSDPDLKGLGAWRDGRPQPSGADYFHQHHDIVRALLSHARREGRIPHTYVRGPEGCAKEDLVLALAHGLGAQILEWDADAILAFSGDWAELLTVADRDLRLRTAFLWIRRADALVGAGEAHRPKLRVLGRFLADRPAVNVVLTAETGPGELRAILGVNLIEVEIAPPTVSQRAQLWRAAVGEDIARDRAELWDALSAKFRFGPGKIRASVEALQWGEASTGEGSAWDQALHRACRAASSQGLEALVHKLPIKYRWADLVLPEDVMEQLREIRNCVRLRRRVYDDWGFEGKFSLGKGLNVIFSGGPGTGKTMSAEILAGDLGLDLYQIDLSTVVSKYIGETEKNLSRIFREAQSANCILLFDEADALFGKRSEVRDSHDRYANIEINYLLQRMDNYEGVVILTTNMLRNLDAAFTRRIHYTVEFPFPDERQREELWSKVFPAETPRSDDLDLTFLARRFKLTGASIKNIALNGAFLAAADGRVVDMAHVVGALKREYRKMGKLCSRSEFGPYYALVRDREDREESATEDASAERPVRDEREASARASG